MSIDLVVGLVLGLVLLLGTLTKVNIGALGLIAAYLVATLCLSENVDEVLAGFPGDLFVLIVGVTYLFSVASSNGTLEWIIDRSTRLIGSRAVALPFGAYLAGLAIASIGALAPAVVAILAPIAIRLGLRVGTPPFLAGMSVVLGVVGGSFSPLNVLALVTNGTLRSVGLEPAELSLFLGTIATTAVLLTLVQVAHAVPRRQAVSVDLETVGVHAGGAGGAGGVGGSDGAESRRGSEAGPVPTLAPPVLSTLFGVIGVLVLVVAIDADLGFTALGIAALLHLVFPRPGSTNSIAWEITLLICGLVTYIGVVQRAGTLDRLGDALVSSGSPLIACFLICLSTALLSAFASSPAIIGASMALMAPLIADGQVGLVGATIAVCMSATLVDASPFSSLGALTIAGSPEAVRPAIYRRVLTWGMSMIVIGPLVTCAAFVWLPSLVW